MSLGKLQEIRRKVERNGFRGTILGFGPEYRRSSSTLEARVWAKDPPPCNKKRLILVRQVKLCRTCASRLRREKRHAVLWHGVRAAIDQAECKPQHWNFAIIASRTGIDRKTVAKLCKKHAVTPPVRPSKWPHRLVEEEKRRLDQQVELLNFAQRDEESCIYLVTNEINKKRYVGLTQRTIGERWKEHVDDACRGMEYPLARAIRRHTVCRFTIRVLTYASSSQELEALEQQYIRKFNTHDRRFGYNGTLGGEGGLQTEETRRKMSRAKKGKPIPHLHTPEVRARISVALRGRKLSPEWRKKLSDSHKGKPTSPKQRAVASATLKRLWKNPEQRARFLGVHRGKHISSEHKAAISKANKGRRFSIEHREKLSAARMGQTPWNKGKRPSAETLARISASLRKRWDDPQYRGKLSVAHSVKRLSPETRAKMSAAARLRWTKGGPNAEQSGN